MEHGSIAPQGTLTVARPVPPPAVRVWRWTISFLRNKPLGAIGGIIVIFLILIAILAPLLTPYDPIQVRADWRLLPPDTMHPLGADEQGRDVLSRVLFGARVSLYVALGTVVINTLIASVVGILSGYMGGTFDSLVQRIVDAIMAFPFLILMLTLMMMFGSSMENLFIALGFVLGVKNSRVVRAAVLSLKENAYIEAARAIGGSGLRIMVVHLLPNTFAPLIVIASLTWAQAILAESSLSFLGFGVPPPDPSWGRMISGKGRELMEQAPWIALFPGIALSLTVFGFSMLGDALRDVLDPRLKGTQ